MSGQYGARTGVYTVGGTERFDWSQRPLRPVENVTDLPLDRDIIARQLKVGGYATGMFGKWEAMLPTTLLCGAAREAYTKVARASLSSFVGRA